MILNHQNPTSPPLPTCSPKVSAMHSILHSGCDSLESMRILLQSCFTREDKQHIVSKTSGSGGKLIAQVLALKVPEAFPPWVRGAWRTQKS
eukprot:2611579-Amphidinium_carterae.1